MLILEIALYTLIAITIIGLILFVYGMITATDLSPDEEFYNEC